MAAIKKIDNECLLNAAYDLVRREGLASLSARRLAVAASCSTQPIYENFSGMSKVIEITTQRMNDAFAELVSTVGKQENAGYAKQGIEICRYADEERVLFRHFVADNSRGMEMLDNKWNSEMLKEIYGVGGDQTEKVDRAMKDYILGKAFLINAGYEKFDADKIERDVNAYLEFAINK